MTLQEFSFSNIHNFLCFKQRPLALSIAVHPSLVEAISEVLVKNNFVLRLLDKLMPFFPNTMTSKKKAMLYPAS